MWRRDGALATRRAATCTHISQIGTLAEKARWDPLCLELDIQPEGRGLWGEMAGEGDKLKLGFLAPSVLLTVDILILISIKVILFFKAFSIILLTDFLVLLSI